MKVPARKESNKESFSPSGWHVYRNKVVETGTRSSVYTAQVGSRGPLTQEECNKIH